MPLLNMPIGALNSLTILGGATGETLAVDVDYGLVDIPFSYDGSVTATIC